MTDLSPAEKIAILNRTVDWLEANPGKALRGTLAQNDLRLPRSPLATDATCFCFVGRLIVEAGIRPDDDLSYRNNITDWLAPFDASVGSFYTRNDSYFKLDDRIRVLRQYIAFLERESA